MFVLRMRASMPACVCVCIVIHNIMCKRNNSNRSIKKEERRSECMNSGLWIGTSVMDIMLV